MISVTRKTHMPKVDASRCCSRLSKWWASAVGWLANGGLLGSEGRLLAVVVGSAGDDRGDVEVVGWRRRVGVPLEADRAPGVGRAQLPVAHRPDEVGSREEVAEAEDRGAGGRQHVEDLELRRVGPVAPRHAEVSQDELGEEGEVEAD